MEEHSLDTILRLVADQRRRQVIRYLRHDTNGNTTIDQLVDQLHQDETGTETVDRGLLTSQLYHNHLPKLADYGIVEFDPEHDAVRYQLDEQTERLLDALSDELSLART